jgi:hypothetical protein
MSVFVHKFVYKRYNTVHIFYGFPGLDNTFYHIGMGAAMLASYGLGWFKSMEDCVDAFIEYDKTYYPPSSYFKGVTSALKTSA